MHNTSSMSADGADEAHTRAPRSPRGAAGDRRARVLAVVRDAPGPVDAEAVAAAVDLSTSTARFHLDRLVADGTVEVARDPVPRPGRPRLVYQAIPVVAVDAEAAMLRLARLMAASLDDAASGAAERAGRAWAVQVLQRHVGSGNTLPAPGAPHAVDALLALAEQVLHDEGFAPEPGPQAGTLELRRCPYLSVAAEHPRAVCGMHLGLLRGLADGMGVDAAWRLTPVLDGSAPCTVALVEPSARHEG